LGGEIGYLIVPKKLHGGDLSPNSMVRVGRGVKENNFVQWRGVLFKDVKNSEEGLPH